MGRGDGQHGDVAFTAAILEGKPIKLFNDGHLRRDFTYIDDVTEAVSRLLTRPPRSMRQARPCATVFKRLRSFTMLAIVNPWK